MSSIEPNFSFRQPTDTKTKVWRYLDLAKAIILLQTEKLFFCRLDSFNDKHEGSITSPMFEAKHRMAQKVGAPSITEILASGLRCTRKITYANCWHLNNSESEAMWQLYCPNNQGVAVQTTYEKLNDSAQKWDNAVIGLVTYLNYQLDEFQMDNFLNVFMQKRQAFQHENEVRILIHKYELLKELDEPTLAALLQREAEYDQQPKNIQVDWNLEENIENIFINPYAPAWYFEMFQNLIHSIRPSLANRVKTSNLSVNPVF